MMYDVFWVILYVPLIVWYTPWMSHRVCFMYFMWVMKVYLIAKNLNLAKYTNYFVENSKKKLI